MLPQTPLRRLSVVAGHWPQTGGCLIEFIQATMRAGRSPPDFLAVASAADPTEIYRVSGTSRHAKCARVAKNENVAGAKA